MFKSVLIALASGGLITSLAEYFLHYNLVDLVKDKILAIFGKAKAAEVKLQAEVKAKL